MTINLFFLKEKNDNKSMPSVNEITQIKYVLVS